MRILVVNPNSTVSMTASIEQAANSFASGGTTIIAKTSGDGPVSIEGYFDEAMSLSGLLRAIHESNDVDAVVIACFDDTGLDAARCLTDKPVIGIGEAAYRYASMVSNKFSVVTTLARSVPALEHNLRRYGLFGHCVKVRSSDVAVLDLESNDPTACNKIDAEIIKAIKDDRAEAIVLGCAGMASLAQSLTERHGVPVLDGLSCAISLAESMVRLGLKTSRVGGYAPPPNAKLDCAFGPPAASVLVNVGADATLIRCAETQ
jgi:allantoin racemase